MSNAARAIPMNLPSESPIKPEDLPSTMHINVKKAMFLKEAKPHDGLRLSINAIVKSVRMDDDGEHFITAEIQEAIPQAKEEKPPEETSGLIPK